VVNTFISQAPRGSREALGAFPQVKKMGVRRACLEEGLTPAGAARRKRGGVRACAASSAASVGRPRWPGAGLASSLFLFLLLLGHAHVWIVPGAHREGAAPCARCHRYLHREMSSAGRCERVQMGV
jgi:hypothetical protein